MKKTLALVMAVLLTITIVRAQVGWITHKADNRISVKFPNEPKEVTPGTFVALDKIGKDSVGYSITVVDLEKVAGIDSATLTPIKATQQFADQLKAGMKQSLTDIDLQDFKISTWKGFTSYSTTGNGATKKQTMYIFMVLIGSKMYSLSSVVPNGVATTGRDEFFSSLTLTN